MASAPVRITGWDETHHFWGAVREGEPTFVGVQSLGDAYMACNERGADLIISDGVYGQMVAGGEAPTERPGWVLSDDPVLELVPPQPAGTIGRPPFPIELLPEAAWHRLVERQQSVPVRRINTMADWHAVSLNEQRAVFRVADELHLDEDQQYSLLHHHHEAIHQRCFQAHPDVVPDPNGRYRVLQAGHVPGGGVLVGGGRRRPRRRAFPIGWGTWFGNRHVQARAAWLRWTRQQ